MSWAENDMGKRVIMKLSPIEIGDLERIRRERNNLPAGILRTPYLLTEGMHRRWWESQIDNRDSHTRYWMLQVPAERINQYGTTTEVYWENEPVVGYGGIENIEFESGHAEMSLMIYEDKRGCGYGTEAVRMFLEEAFFEMGLDTVYAEVYECNPNKSFWKKHDHSHHTVLRRRKRLAGKLYDSDVYYWYKEMF